MKIRDIATRARKSIAHAKARTILTSLAIGVGAFTITLSLAAGVGGKDYAREIVTSNVDPAQIMVTKKAKDVDGPAEYSDSGSVTIEGGVSGTIETLNDTDLAVVRKIAGVSTAFPSLGTSPLYVTSDSTSRKFELSAIDVYSPSIHYEYASGNGAKLDNNGVIVSDEYRKALGYSSPQAAIGRSLQIAFENTTLHPERKIFILKIAAVTDKNGVASAMASPVLVSQATLQSMHDFQYKGTPYESAYMYILANTSSEQVVRDVKAALEKKGYQAQSAEDLMSFIFQFINVLQGILLGFGALAVLTSIFGIINTQYISVLERTQQIGLMKALGMRRRDVGRLFKFEAAWIGFLGGAIGSGLAWLTGTLVNPHISPYLKLGDGTSLLIFSWWIFAVVIGGLMAVSVGAGILPARKAAKLDPIEALRTE